MQSDRGADKQKIMRGKNERNRKKGFRKVVTDGEKCGTAEAERKIFYCGNVRKQ